MNYSTPSLRLNELPNRSDGVVEEGFRRKPENQVPVEVGKDVAGLAAFPAHVVQTGRQAVLPDVPARFAPEIAAGINASVSVYEDDVIGMVTLRETAADR